MYSASVQRFLSSDLQSTIRENPLNLKVNLNIWTLKSGSAWQQWRHLFARILCLNWNKAQEIRASWRVAVSTLLKVFPSKETCSIMISCRLVILKSNYQYKAYKVYGFFLSLIHTLLTPYNSRTSQSRKEWKPCFCYFLKWRYVSSSNTIFQGSRCIHSFVSNSINRGPFHFL